MALATPSPIELDTDNRLSVPIPRLVLGVLRFDPHPPLYYLQLHFWMMHATSETLLRANSALWAVLAAVSIVPVGTRLVGRRSAIIAACVFIVSPLLIGFSWQVRMYTMWMLEAVLAAWLNDLVLRPAVRHRRLAALGFAAVVSAGFATHGAGFLLGPALAVHGLLLIRERHPDRRTIGLWIGSLAVAGLSAVPWLARAAFATPPLGHLEAATLTNVGKVLTSLAVGDQLSQAWPVQVVALGAWAAIVVVGSQNQQCRTVVVSYLIVPLAVCFVLSRTVAPLWHVRALSFLVPFLCLAVGSTVVAVGRRFAATPGRAVVLEVSLASAVVIAGMVATLSLDLERGRKPGFREAVAFTRQIFTGHDVVVIPNPRVFWSWGWYAAGPGTVDVLDSTQVLRGSKGELIVHEDGLDVPGAAHLWLIRRSTSEVIEDEDAVEVASRTFGEVEVVEVTRDDHRERL